MLSFSKLGRIPGRKARVNPPCPLDFPLFFLYIPSVLIPCLICKGRFAYAPDGTLRPVPASVSSSPTINYQLLYQPVFDSYRLFLSGEEITLADNTERQDYYLIMGETGISFLCRYGGTIGYRFQDLNDDGIPEMLISAIGSDYYDGYLYDLFTLIDGVPSRVLASSERVRYQLMSDNRIYHEGSAGAGLNICFLYRFNGTSLVLEDGVVMNDGPCFEITEEHTNIFEKTESDREISEEEYFALSESWRSMVTNVEITAF